MKFDFEHEKICLLSVRNNLVWASHDFQLPLYKFSIMPLESKTLQVWV